MLHRETRLPWAPCLLARGTLLGCRVARLTEVRGPRYIPRQLLMLTTSGDYAQLVECKIIGLDTEKRPLAERVIKQIKLAAKTFLSAILFVVLSGRSKGGLCFNPPSRVARLAGAPCLHVNRVLVPS